MSYNPENNPYIPGDPYSYDLKWVVAEIKHALELYVPLHDEFVDLHDYVMDYFANLDLTAEVSAKIEEMYNDGRLQAIIDELFTDYTADINNQLNVLTARMDEFTVLPSGSTAGDAELMDIRVGFNGVTYDSAGNAVRAEADQLNDSIETLGAGSFVTERAADPPGLWPLTASSGINPATGQNYTADTWARTGWITLHGPMILKLNLSDYIWNAYFFRTNTFASHMHSATQQRNYAGTDNIYVNPTQANDNMIVISFRRVDQAALTTDTSDSTSDFYKIQHALHIYEDTAAADIDYADFKLTALADGAYGNLKPSTTFDGLYSLTASSGVMPENGYNSTSAIYCRTAFLAVNPRRAHLGLSQYDWNAYYFSGNAWNTRLESATAGKWVDGTDEIITENASNPSRVNVIFTFRRKDGATLTTDTSDVASDFSIIRNALRLYGPANVKEKSIMYFGDSIARGVTYESGSLAWATRANRIPNMIMSELSVNCQNFGIGNIGWISGYTSAIPTKTNVYGYLQRIGDPAWYDPGNAAGSSKFVGRGSWADFNTIVISVGTNDGAYPLGSLDDADIAAADAGTISLEQVLAWPTSAANSGSTYKVIVKAMYQAYRYIRSIAPHINIILVDPLITKGGASGAPPEWGYDVVQTGGYTRRQMNDLYAAFCKKYGLGHISTYDAPIDRTDITNSLYDGVHPVNASYKALGLFFASKLA